jgi:hypothetical protein
VPHAFSCLCQGERAPVPFCSVCRCNILKLFIFYLEGARHFVHPPCTASLLNRAPCQHFRFSLLLREGHLAHIQEVLRQWCKTWGAAHHGIGLLSWKKLPLAPSRLRTTAQNNTCRAIFDRTRIHGLTSSIEICGRGLFAKGTHGRGGIDKNIDAPE